MSASVRRYRKFRRDGTEKKLLKEHVGTSTSGDGRNGLARDGGEDA